MVQNIRDQQLQAVPLLNQIAQHQHDSDLALNQIAQQQRDSDLALKSVMSEIQLLKSKTMPQQSQVCHKIT